MARKQRVNTPEMYAENQRYIKETYRWVDIQFSKKDPMEMALYEHIAKQGMSKAAYLKSLVMKDMNGGDE